MQVTKACYNIRVGGLNLVQLNHHCIIHSSADAKSLKSEIWELQANLVTFGDSEGCSNGCGARGRV